MISQILISTKKLSALAQLLAQSLISLLMLASVSPQVFAENIPVAQGPCGILTSMGDHTRIYNNSRYAWNVVFKTTTFSDAEGSVNAAAVKYLNDGVWTDNGTGDYRNEKIYIVPVNAGETVKIAYCADSSLGDKIVRGDVSILWNYTSSSNYANNGHGQPDGNVKFFAINSTPIFKNNGTTPYVNYNKNRDAVFENGSLTVCPKDPECKVP